MVEKWDLFWNRSNTVNCANFVWKCGRWSFSDRFPLSLRSISFYGIEWFQFTLLLIFSRNCSRFFQHYTHRQSRIFPSGIFPTFSFIPWVILQSVNESFWTFAKKCRNPFNYSRKRIAWDQPKIALARHTNIHNFKWKSFSYVCFQFLRQVNFEKFVTTVGLSRIYVRPFEKAFFALQ